MAFSFRVSRVTFYGLTWLAGCQAPLPDSGPPDTEYVPLETNRYFIYDVEEQQYRSDTVFARQLYQLKELTGPAYTDVTGQMAYRILRFRRASADQRWQPDSVWSARITATEAIRTENGRDFVQLLFPVQDKATWNGNRYNSLGPATYQVRNAGKPYRVLEKLFPETVTVIEQNDSTLISQNKRMEVYARQVGLIYQERVNLQFCIATPACTGHAQIDYGTQQIYRIRAYGIE